MMGAYSFTIFFQIKVYKQYYRLSTPTDLIMNTQIYLILLMCLSSLQSPTPSTLQISRTNCILQYQRISNSILFHQCIGPNYKHNQWAQCFRLCCNQDLPDQFETPTVEALVACKTGNMPSSGLSVTAIAFIVVCSVLASLSCLCFLYKICFKLRSRNSRAKIISAISVQWKQQLHVNTKSNNIVWSNEARASKMLRNTQQPCTVCLEEHETMAELYCKHQYHPKCIGLWLRKSDCCPCCRMQDIRGIKIYCKECRWRYFISTKLLIKRMADHFPDKCDYCQRERGEVVDSLVEIFPQQSNDILQANRNIQESVE